MKELRSERRERDGANGRVSDTLPPPSQRVLLRPRDGVAVLVFLGEHDVLTEEELKSELIELVAESALVVADLSYATFVDSSLVHNLIRARQQASATSHRFVVQTGDNKRVLRVLEIMGVLDQLHCVETRDEAVNGRPTVPARALN